MPNSQPLYGNGLAPPVQGTPSQQNPPPFPQYHYQDPRERHCYIYAQNGYQQPQQPYQYPYQQPIAPAQAFYQQPNGVQPQHQHQQPSYAPSQPQQLPQQQQQNPELDQPTRYYTAHGQPHHPQVTYTYDSWSGRYFYDARQMAAVLKRGSEAQSSEAIPASKRQKNGPAPAAGPVVIDLENYQPSVNNRSAPQQQPGMVTEASQPTNMFPALQPAPPATDAFAAQCAAFTASLQADKTRKRALQELDTNAVTVNGQEPRPPVPMVGQAEFTMPKENASAAQSSGHPYPSAQYAPTQVESTHKLTKKERRAAARARYDVLLADAWAKKERNRAAMIANSRHPKDNNPSNEPRVKIRTVRVEAKGRVTESFRSPPAPEAAVTSKPESTDRATALTTLPQSLQPSIASRPHDAYHVQAPKVKQEEAGLAELLEQERALERAVARKKQRRALLASSPPGPKTVMAPKSEHVDNQSTSPNTIKPEPSLAYATPAPSSSLAVSTSTHPTHPSVAMPTSTFNPSQFFYDPNAPPPAYIPPSSLAMPSSSAPQPKPPRPRAEPAADTCGNPEPPLCAEQQELVNLILSGRNVFYTGSAGCGKSTVLKAFVRRLKDMNRHVNIIAPTGRAALQVNGTTTWTYAGITPLSHKESLDELKKRAHGTQVHKRFRTTDVLVIDEISMVENHHLERINEMMKEARGKKDLRGNDLPFGGVQVIVTGDFCQLPPVKPFQYCLYCGKTLTEGRDRIGKFYKCYAHGQFRDEDKWAFRSKAWEESNFVHFELKQVHRQSDQLFIGILQKCRMGMRLPEGDIEVLMDHHVAGVKKSTQLHAVRSAVDAVNRERFNSSPNQAHAFFALDKFRAFDNLPFNIRNAHERIKDRDRRRPESMPPTLEKLKDHRFDECTELKHGMLVVLLTNLDLDAGLCNGSQGIICGWEPHDPKNIPKAVSAMSNKRREQVPPDKRLYGDLAVMKESAIHEFIAAQPGYHVEKGVRMEQRKAWPKVKFHNGEQRTIYAECSITELGDEKPYSLLSRTQIPLAPAWAMTIHKAQGMTMDKVVVNLSRAFEEGQVYVALSRARSLEGLKIEGTADALRGGLGQNREVQRFFREKFGYVGAEGEEDEREGEDNVGPWCPGIECPGCEVCCGGDEEEVKAEVKTQVKAEMKKESEVMDEPDVKSESS